MKVNNLVANGKTGHEIPFNLIHEPGSLRSTLLHSFGEIGITFDPDIKDVYQPRGEVAIYVNFDYFSSARYFYVLKSDRIVTRSVFRPFNLDNPPDEVIRILNYLENMDDDLHTGEDIELYGRRLEVPLLPGVLPKPYNGSKDIGDSSSLVLDSNSLNLPLDYSSDHEIGVVEKGVLENQPGVNGSTTPLPFSTSTDNETNVIGVTDEPQILNENNGVTLGPAPTQGDLADSPQEIVKIPEGIPSEDELHSPVASEGAYGAGQSNDDSSKTTDQSPVMESSRLTNQKVGR